MLLATKRSAPRRFILVIATRSMAGLAVEDHSSIHPVQEVPHHPVTIKGSAREEFWRVVPTFQNVTAKDFLSYRWSVS